VKNKYQQDGRSLICHTARGPGDIWGPWLARSYRHGPIRQWTLAASSFLARTQIPPAMARRHESRGGRHEPGRLSPRGGCSRPWASRRPRPPRRTPVATGSGRPDLLLLRPHVARFFVYGDNNCIFHFFLLLHIWRVYSDGTLQLLRTSWMPVCCYVIYFFAIRNIIHVKIHLYEKTFTRYSKPIRF
jgi:hypothetical protein